MPTEIEDYCHHQHDRLKALLGEEKFARFDQGLRETDDIVGYLNRCEKWILTIK